MNYFQYRDRELFCEDVPLAELAERYGTPLYVYSHATFERHFKPTYESLMADGEISGWGYLKHHTGGPWRRVSYHIGPGVVETMKAIGKAGEMLDKRMKPRDNDFGKACRSHDDYIWQIQQGNSTEQRGMVGMSVYFVCKMASENRADELAEKVFGPVYEAQLGEGQLTSWGWASHVVGGEYRRLLTTSAASLDDLFAARASILGGFADSSAAREFNSICYSHTDYVWNIAMEGRQAK